MKLDVLPTKKGDPALWYAEGLQFTCTQCGNCCSGGPGFVWISREEVVKLAAFLKITPEETVEQYCRTVDGELSLNEVENELGAFDCVFLKPQPGPDGKPTAKRGCSIYSVRPLQCRTWPFWPELLSSRRSWDYSSRKCHGMDIGRKFSVKEIHAVRDANDWPKNPPTSDRPASEKPSVGKPAARRK